MLKLYRIEPKSTLYWETWDNGDGSHTVHRGELGKKGASKTVRRFLFQTADEKVKAEAEQRLAEGYKPIDLGDHRVLMIEYSVDGFGDAVDLDKRHRLESRMNQTLGWTVEADLQGTEFADYTRIYDEGASPA